MDILRWLTQSGAVYYQKGLFNNEVILDQAWAIEAVDADNDSGRYTSIAVDADDRPHIAYQDDGYGAARYGYRAADGWDIKTVWDGGMNARYLALALDAAQRPHVAFQADYGLPIDLEYAVWNGSSWEIETVDTGGTVGKHASLALDAAGRPHLSYSVMYGGESSWRYATRQGEGWQLHTLDSSFSFDVGLHTSIAVDATGAVSVAASSGIVEVARGRGTSFVLETVAGGSYPSLTLDPSGAPVLAFHDGMSGTLNYAYLLGGTWASQVVDGAAFVGEYAALALTASGAPVIAYSDRSAHQLKLAR